MFYRGDKVFAVRYGPWKAHFITQTAYPNGPLEYQDPPLLYNLESDPSEKYNLAAKHPEIIGKIKELKEAHEKTVVTTRKPSIEAESLIERAQAAGGKLRVQNMSAMKGEWSGNAQLWWLEALPGNRLTLPLEAPVAGTYDLFGFFTRARDYGIIRVFVNDKPTGSLIDCYADRVEPTGPLSLGKVELPAGQNKVEIEVVGKDIRSAGYLVGVDGFLLRK